MACVIQVPERNTSRSRLEKLKSWKLANAHAKTMLNAKVSRTTKADGAVSSKRRVMLQLGRAGLDP